MDRRARVSISLGAAFVVAGAAALLLSSRKDKGMDHREYIALGEFASQDSLPRVQYFDGGQISLNFRCAVRKVKLNPKMPPVYVNGQPIGFC